tara:strand:- start:765 stop:1202 length:438 start_codon:yes stop_codon:yes gene_type:complete
MQIITLLILLTVSNPIQCDKEFLRAYDLAVEWVYPRSTSIGPLLPLEEHKCDGWLPLYWNPGKVVVRPLYSDSGLPLYDIFEDEWEELKGFEFRILHIITYTCRLANITKGIEAWECRENYREILNGYSISLTIEEQFVYASLKF